MSTDPGTAPGHPTLQSFSLDDLAVYTAEQAFGPTASPDFRVFYVGRDDVHGVLMHLFTRVTLSVKMNMYGYDDDDLNNVLMNLVKNRQLDPKKLQELSSLVAQFGRSKDVKS